MRVNINAGSIGDGRGIMALPHANRRQFVMGSATLPLLSMSASAGAAIAASIESDLHRYVGFGNKQAGGTGDNGCGDWLASELEQAGFAVERQAVSVPWFAPDRCEIAADGARAALWPQPIVRLTGAAGRSDIGRASCRERVCQYVYISVVAV